MGIFLSCDLSGHSIHIDLCKENLGWLAVGISASSGDNYSRRFRLCSASTSNARLCGLSTCADISHSALAALSQFLSCMSYVKTVAYGNIT